MAPGQLFGVHLHLCHGPNCQLPRLLGLVHLLAGMKLDHFVHPDNAYGVDEALQVHGHRSFLVRARIAGLLSGKGHTVILDDLVHPLPLDLEDLYGGVHELSEVLKEEVVVSSGQVGGSRAVQRHDLPGTHGEVLSIDEMQLVFELVVAIVGGCKLVRTALVARYPLARTTVGWKLVVEIGRAVLRCQLES